MNLIIENTVENFDASTLPLKKAFTLTSQDIQQDLDVSLLFVSLDEMFNLNNQLRGKSQPTDVLSLPSDTNAGEIFICPEYIFSQGYDNDRIVHLFVHGLLHLAGYTHDHDDDFKEMSQHEIQICKKLGIDNIYS